MKVKLKRWHGVAVWKWDVEDDVCGICRMAYDACCPDCTMPGDNCPPVWGECNHAFHIHCAMKWLASQAQAGGGAPCPMCRRDFKFKES
ncbi:anaphase promoting complex subunit 11 [Tribonema minus]|uniref:Anaphase-promoting complex subunit 11 n=1 Tax=Tribonema minus TaxID=303371 RepID=A0A835ZF45_9STRA|nr:anaphase promoting complex subunit 11 [Tribonema minus]